jgi:cell division protein FtsQ
MITMEDSYNSIQFVSRRERRDKKKKMKMIGLIIVILLLAALVTFLLLPISKINSIAVNGLELLTAEEVKTQALMYEGMSYFLANTEKSKLAIEKLHICKEATVEKHFPGKIDINIVENSEVAYLYDKDEWFVVLENGYVSDRVTEIDFSKRPLITEWTDVDLLPLLASELYKTKKSVIAEISDIQLSGSEGSEKEVLIYSWEGYHIYVKLDDFSQQMNKYLEIVETLKGKESEYGIIYLYDTIRFEKFSHGNGNSR